MKKIYSHFHLNASPMKEIVNYAPLIEIQRKLKLRYPELTESDLQLYNDNKNEMLQVIAYKLRKTKKEMLRIIQLL